MATQQQSQELSTGNPSVPNDQRAVIIALSHCLAAGNDLASSISMVESQTPVQIDNDTYSVGNSMIDNLNDVLVSVDAQLPQVDDTADYSITPAMSTAIAIMHATTGIVMHREIQHHKNMSLTYGRLLILSTISNIAMVVTAWLT